MTLELSTVTLCFFYKAAVSSRTSKRPPAGTPPKLRKVTSIATCSLAELYASGTGVARDPVQAYALAAIAEVVLDDSDLFGVRLAKMKAAVGRDLSPFQLLSPAHALRQCDQISGDVIPARSNPSRLCQNRAIGSHGVSIWADCDDRGLSERPARNSIETGVNVLWSEQARAPVRPNTLPLFRIS